MNVAVRNLAPASPIVLAHERPFRLGAVELRPGTREAIGPHGRAVLEPRVMQVLVALAQAGGETVTRDHLIATCWGGRVVGEDAISRVISRLRRLSEGVGRDGWTLETITKVGYRLTPLGAGASDVAAPTGGARPSRRIVIGGAVAATAAAGAGGLAYWRLQRPQASPRARQLVARAKDAISEGMPEETAQAIGFLREAVADSPNYAAAWGALALAYQSNLGFTPPAQQEGVARLAKAAATRGLELDHNDPDANAAMTATVWLDGDTAEIERRLVAGRRRNPNDPRFHAGHSRLLTGVGRMREAVAPAGRAVELDGFAPWLRNGLGLALWGAGRTEEAERTIREALALWPRHHALWFALFNILAHTGRPDQALAFAEDPSYRPGTVPAPDLELSLIGARAMATRSAREIEAVVERHTGAARRGVGYAENAILWTSALGRLDEAFDVARAYYLDQGFKVPDQRFSPEQNRFNVAGSRQTHLLFMPPTEPMRRDARVAPILRDVGLVRYWRAVGRLPDDPSVARWARA